MCQARHHFLLEKSHYIVHKLTLQGEQCVMSSLYSCFVMAVYCTYVPSFTVVVVRHVLTSYIRLAIPDMYVWITRYLV